MTLFDETGRKIQECNKDNKNYINDLKERIERQSFFENLYIGEKTIDKFLYRKLYKFMYWYRT